MGYSVIGRNLLNDIAPALEGSQKVLLVSPSSLAATSDLLKEVLQDSGFEVLLAEVPAGEEAKRIEVAAFCWKIMGQANFNRNDCVIGVGGGSTTDLAGFVAANWLRGVRLFLVPTTLLAMVDAAIGGKTGINTAEGKNLVGSFYLPSKVFVDLNTLESLPRNELLAGMAEVVKYGFIEDVEILNKVLESDQSTDITSSTFEWLITRCIEIKERITSLDLKDLGEREFLNYGHTLGHAIEHAERYKWRHGAAIAIGMVFAAELSQLVGKLSGEDVDKHRAVFSKLGLPMSYRADRFDQLVATMQRDKKTRSGVLRFIVLDKIGKPTILTSPSRETLFTAYQAIVE
jgi:3-dehydroquinate synthase